MSRTLDDGTIGTGINGVPTSTPVPVGFAGYQICPYEGILEGYSIIANQSGTATFDVWKVSSGNVPTVLDSIVGSNKPHITSQQIVNVSDTTGWSVYVAKGDVFGFHVDSIDGSTEAIFLTLNIRKI